MTNTALNTREVVEELINDMLVTCEGSNELGYIMETCNYLFTYYTEIVDVYQEDYASSGKYYLGVWGEDEESKFDYLVLQVELIESENGEYEIYDIYETSKY